MRLPRPELLARSVRGRIWAASPDASDAVSVVASADVLDLAGSATIPLTERPSGAAVLPKSLSLDSLES
jgi:hypothetical protein